MSIAATNWVWSLNDKALPNASTKLALLKHADHAHDDGTHTWQTVPTIAKFALCSTRTAQRMNVWLLENGLIREGDQSVIPDKYKNGTSVPVAFELAMNETTRMQWEIDHAAGTSNPLYRASQAAGAKGGQKTAAIKAAAKTQVSGGDNLAPQEVVSTPDAYAEVGGDNLSPHAGGDSDDTEGVTNETGGGDTGVTQTTQATTQGNQKTSWSETADAATDRQPSEDEQEAEDKRLTDGRADVERICEHLLARLVEQDIRPVPKIGQTWRNTARLMLDRDDRTEQQVHNMIDWATNHEFWRAHVQSMPKLREKYDAMRIQALESVKRPGGRAAAYSDQRTWGDVTPERDLSHTEAAALFGTEPQPETQQHPQAG